MNHGERFFAQSVPLAVCNLFHIFGVLTPSD